LVVFSYILTNALELLLKHHCFIVKLALGLLDLALKELNRLLTQGLVSSMD